MRLRVERYNDVRQKKDTLFELKRMGKRVYVIEKKRISSIIYRG